VGWLALTVNQVVRALLGHQELGRVGVGVQRVGGDHRAGEVEAGQHRGGGQPQDAGQRVAAPGRPPRVTDGGQVGEQVGALAGAERVGVAQQRQPLWDRGRWLGRHGLPPWS
jgi:hypothetical protein